MQQMEGTVKQLDSSQCSEIVKLTCLLNDNLSPDLILIRQEQMFLQDNYRCFGLYINNILVGVSGAWLTTRLYSGKQLEIDHFIIHPNHQDKGLGQRFIDFLQEYALQQNCESVELNAYVSNHLSHRFYFKNGFKILGYHFVKRLK